MQSNTRLFLMCNHSNLLLVDWDILDVQSHWGVGGGVDSVVFLFNLREYLFWFVKENLSNFWYYCHALNMGSAFSKL